MNEEEKYVPWDMTPQELPPFQTILNPLLEQHHIKANKAWCETLGALEWETFFPDHICRNRTYYVFSNMLYNYRTGKAHPPKKGFFLPFHSEKGKKKKKDGEQVPIPVDLFSHLPLPKFPRNYDKIVTKVK